MNVHVVDRLTFLALDERGRKSIERGLLDIGVDLGEAREAYTDDKGKVVGAERYLLDESGRRFIDESDETRAATEIVGVGP